MILVANKSLRLVKSIAYRSIREQLHDFRLIVFGLGTVALVAVSTYTGIAAYGRRIRAYEASVHRETNSGLDGVAIFRRPPRFLFISEGGESEIPATLIAVPNYLDLPHDDVTTHPDVVPRAVQLDWAFGFGYVCTLALLLTSSDLIVRHRDAGTLRLTLSYGVHRTTLLVGEYVGSVAASLPFIVLSMAAGCLIALSSGEFGWRADDVIRLAAMFVLTTSIMFFVASVGLLISVLVRNRHTALLMAIGFWLLAAIVLPSTAQPLAHVLSPAPSPREHAIALENAERMFGTSIVVSSQMLRPVTDAVGLSENDRIALLRRIQADVIEEHEAKLQAYRERLLAIRGDYLARVARERELAAELREMSPLAFYAALAADVAGSGPINQSYFERAAADFLPKYSAAALALRRSQRQYAHVSGPFVEDGPYRLQGVSAISYSGVPYDPQLLPRFHGYETPYRESLWAAVEGALVFLCLSAILLGCACARFTSYDLT